MSTDPEKSSTIKEAVFDEDKVADCFSKAIKLQDGMKKLQHLCNLTGGSDLAVKTITDAYLTNGADHLEDKYLYKTHNHYNACLLCMC